MSAVAIIPARGGSRRILRKNIRDFHGKPIIAFSIEAAKASGLFASIIVSTDDDEISAVAKTCGATVLSRAPQMAEDNIGTQEVAAYVLRQCMDPQHAMAQFVYACCIYPCAPMLEPDDLRAAYSMLMLRPCSYVVAVGDEPLRDIGNFYFGSAGFFLGGRPLYNTHTGLYIIPRNRAIDINTPEDWARAERMYVELRGIPA